MFNQKILRVIAFMGIYMFVSILIFIVTNDGLSLWLGFNIILALIPYLLIIFIEKRLKIKQLKLDWISVVLLLVFVFFFPNSFYVITDMIHIDRYEFYSVAMYSTQYHDNIYAYITLFHVLITVLIGIYSGVKSIEIFAKILLEKYTYTIMHIGVFLLLFLSSIGIYIGRFLRFFSWDILNPINILSETLSELDWFMVLFIVLFTFIQYCLYYSYNKFLIKEPM